MFRGKEYSNTKARYEELSKYLKGLHIIFNKKAYTNRENLKQ